MESDTAKSKVTEVTNEVNNNDRNSVDSSSSSSGSEVVLRKKSRSLNLWLPNPIVNAKKKPPMLESIPSVENLADSSSNDSSIARTDDKRKTLPNDFKIKESSKRGWKTIVTIVLVEARGLPEPPSDGSSHALYCKIRLGSESYKSKSVPNIQQPEWKERFQLHLNKDPYLRLSLWDKGKQKNFMGSGIIDLSSWEKERTHEIWQDLEDGYGSVHLSVTMCAIRDHTPSSDGPNITFVEQVQWNFALEDLNDLKSVGQLHVKVVSARGLFGRPSPYCTLELDNERVQTPSARPGSEPTWNKSYVFNVYDVTSTLDLRVYDSSLVNALNPMRTESIGKILIPLLSISNGESRWYALKDRSRRSSARGNCPRVLLEMSLVYNPVKAAIRVLTPKEVKYIKKQPPKFDIPLIYSNLEFMRDTFKALMEINEVIKQFLEWENRELSTIVYLVWVVFWFFFEPWMGPLLALLPFIYFWVNRRSDKMLIICNKHDDSGDDEKKLTKRIQGLQELTLTITGSVEYLTSVAERIFNLVSFKVPFLSYLAMVSLVFMSLAIYFVPFNYHLIALGTYKYGRKVLNPRRPLHNDVLDFISRIPDNEILKDWTQLSVPEPTQPKTPTTSKKEIVKRSFSTSG